MLADVNVTVTTDFMPSKVGDKDEVNVGLLDVSLRNRNLQANL